MKRIIETSLAATPRGAYAQGWRAGDFVFVSGQVPRDPLTGAVLNGPFTELAIQTLRNIEAVLAAEGATLRDVVKFTVILQDLADNDALNQAFHDVLSEPLPARTTFGGVLRDVPVEIDAIAYLGDRPPTGNGDNSSDKMGV
jgi:2-iminobutanoate/2-iminopropanoate deaminase